MHKGTRVLFSIVFALMMCVPSWGGGALAEDRAAETNSQTADAPSETAEPQPKDNSASSDDATASDDSVDSTADAGDSDESVDAVATETAETETFESANAEADASSDSDTIESEAEGKGVSSSASAASGKATSQKKTVKAKEADELDSGSPVYVNGSTGSDDNSGTKDEPVKTFAKAKELLEASGGDTIYVTGALGVSDTDTWSLDGKTLMREKDYTSELIHVGEGGNLTLQDIVVDGGIQDDAWGVCSGGAGQGGSLVGVFNGASLTVAEGAALQNNHIRSVGHWYPEAGGGIFAMGSGTTVNVEGGTIENNSAVRGGGIYGCNDAVINISGGTIKGNHAVESASTSLKPAVGGCGGGICVYDGADVNFSGGTISGNDAYERGGGISLGTYYAPSKKDYQSILTMTGGTVSDNTAGSAGGGIFVQYGETTTYSIAYVRGGTITRNALTASGDGNNMFGGGGIYVNGIGDGFTAYHNGEAYLTRVEVSGNSAKIYGGGYAGCPSSNTKLDLTSGAVFYGNSAEEGANELYILASTDLGTHSGNPPYSISPSMLGGGAYKWTYNNGSEVPLSALKGTLTAFFHQNLSLNNALTADSPAIKRALSLAKVHITDNTSATRGGGIGSNGTVYFGVEPEETTEVSVSKEWADDDNADEARPTSVSVELYRDGEYVGFQKIAADSDGNWSTTIKNLPKFDGDDGHEYVYTIKEREVEGYVSKIEGSAGDGFIVTNTQKTSVSGAKTWTDDDNRDGLRPESITVRLLADGTEVESKTVTAEDEWKWTFDDLAKFAEDGHKIAYTVKERKVEGYAGTVEGSAAEGFVITNKRITSVSVSKTWNDGDNADKTRPDSVKVQLLANGKPAGEPVELNAANDWKHTWEDLDLREDGKEIAYTVEETDVPEGYEAKVTGDAQSGFTIENTLKPSEGDETVEPPTYESPDENEGADEQPETQEETDEQPETQDETEETPTAKKAPAQQAKATADAQSHSSTGYTASDAPATGDSANIGAFLALAAAAIAILGAVLAIRKKRN